LSNILFIEVSIILLLLRNMQNRDILIWRQLLHNFLLTKRMISRLNIWKMCLSEFARIKLVNSSLAWSNVG